ncbi:MAG: hypothetical protein H0T49_01980 [Chloroflexia bacterium]|jgi:ABC-type glycerol-3-phosphate transport system permease component|nr:hypothetical protein [Chloroflexia bacterium]
MPSLIGPATVAVGVFNFQANWNDFMTPLIRLTRPEMSNMWLGRGLFKQDRETQSVL